MAEKLVVIAEYRDLPQAGLAQSTLEANGVQCFLENQYMVGVNWLYSTALGGIKLKVHSRDVSRANEIFSNLKSGNVEGFSEEKTAPEATCPFCGSTEIITKNYTRKFAAISGRCQERCRFFLSDLSLACRMTLGRFLRVQGDHLHPAPITAGTGPPLRTVGFGSLVNRSSLA
jgi:hypothetical protein